MNKLVKKKKKGFTLIELIAVIAILAVLAVIAVPRVISYVEKSKKVAIQTQASTIYNAAEASYNDGTLKNGTGNDAALVNKDNFDSITVDNAVASLEGNNLLSGINTTNLGPAKTLGNLKALINADASKFTLNGNVLTGNFNGESGKYQPDSTPAK
ncbi:type IV pilin protein [Clostridium sardiniense]|uniref:type IV pilin protein n=1 Tax=Clostridium sardiniense TaxID=29369 RepID=UPI0024354B0B|nr:prepilin-type N-terminal cleavage/methylation domain-containing protein [Clostridium sardiniense]MBM7834440.1 type IV pilus assembly protein PilA [Clostridium sardiniense]